MPKFRDWLLATSPQFPEFDDLAEFLQGQDAWPAGYEKTELIRFLKKSRADHLDKMLVRALDVFELLCTPSMPDGRRLPWEWHNSALVEQTRASMKRHSRQRSISTQEYRWKLGRRLARQMARKTRIYVDLCHWIKMRDFELGRPAPTEYRGILHNLRWLVASQRYICPITQSHLLELQSQSDMVTRLHTARLMEELSSNVVLPDLPEMEKLELRRRAFDTFFGTGAANTDWQVWTKAGFLLGELWPSTPNWMSREDGWWFQKAYIDSIWKTPLAQIVAILSESQSTAQLRKEFAEIMNRDKEERPSGDFEYERNRALAIVLHHIIKPAAYELAHELNELAKTKPDFRMPYFPTEGKRDPWCLPSVQVIAGIEALIRTTNRKFHPNDMIDLYHCAAALPYCQVFLADGPFERIVKDPKLQYDREYGVQVLSEPHRILNFLDKLS